MSATSAPAPSRTPREHLAAPLRAHPVEHEQVALLDALAVSDDLLAALHRDDDRLHARGRLLAPPRRLDLVVRRASGAPWRSRAAATAARSAARLALEPRLRRARDLVASRSRRRGRARGPSRPARPGSAPSRKVADDEAPLALGREERDVPDHHPGEPAAREARRAPARLPRRTGPARAPRGPRRARRPGAGRRTRPAAPRTAAAARPASRPACRDGSAASSSRISWKAAWTRALASSAAPSSRT